MVVCDTRVFPGFLTPVHTQLSFQSHRGSRSVVKCLTRNPGVLGSSRTGYSGFFRGSVLGQDTSEPSLVLVKPRKDMNNVAVTWLKYCWKWHKTTFNQSKATDYFSHMLKLRWEVKICRKESWPQAGLELTTTRSWIWHTHHWATRSGFIVYRTLDLEVAGSIPGSVFTKHSQEHFFVFFSKICKLECNPISNWLNHMV